jgi:hypothetical protein
MKGVRITVTPGELLDRITILEVRAARAEGEARRQARRELGPLLRTWGRVVAGVLGEETPAVLELRGRLKAVNESIWDDEDGVRVCARAGAYGALFVRLTRDAHAKNDERSRLKADVNKLLGSADPGKVYPPAENP